MRKLDYKFKVGIAAISWINDDIPGLGDDTPVSEVLSEMNELGYVATEKGRTFPDDIDELKSLLQAHNIQLASQFVSVNFTNDEIYETEKENFKNSVNFLKEMECEYVIVCEMGRSLHWDQYSGERNAVDRFTSEEEWEVFANRLNIAGEFCNSLGMTLVYHPHAGTVVEQKEEVDKLMSLSDPNSVSLLYDTGHAVYGNYDPLEMLNKYLDRIKYVHYKDVRLDILKKCRKQKKNFREEVLEGIFTVPGDGVIDFEPIMEKLMLNGYKGWVIVEAEQDPLKANPYTHAKKAMEYLTGLESELTIKHS